MRVNLNDFEWPLATARTVLRPVELGDADAMYAYRSREDVCRYLTHPPLTRDGVVARITSRLPGSPEVNGRVDRGIAVMVNGRLVGDAMLRHVAGEEHVWIGYGYHPDVWGQGIATEVVCALARVAHELRIPLWANTFVDNAASQAVLRKAGLEEHHRTEDEPPCIVFATPVRTGERS